MSIEPRDSVGAELVSPNPETSRWQAVRVQSLRLPKPAESVSGRKIGVDRETEIVHGYIVAQEGPFKSEGRGEFDKDALREIVRLMSAAPNGVKSRFSHPDMSSDGIGTFLGRARDPWIDTITLRDSEGELRTDPIECVRADLHLDPSAHKSPKGDLAEYVMTLAESDPDAVSSSLVIRADQEYRIETDGRPKRDADGNELPPLWRPTKIHASDWVCTGDAVDGVLSQQLDMEGLPDGVVRKAAELMDRQFAGKDRAFVESRCIAWLGRYLDRRYGAAEPDCDGPADDADPGATVGIAANQDADSASQPGADDRARRRRQWELENLSNPRKD